MFLTKWFILCKSQRFPWFFLFGNRGYGMSCQIRKSFMKRVQGSVIKRTSARLRSLSRMDFKTYFIVNFGLKLCLCVRWGGGVFWCLRQLHSKTAVLWKKKNILVTINQCMVKRSIKQKYHYVRVRVLHFLIYLVHK